MLSKVKFRFAGPYCPFFLFLAVAIFVLFDEYFTRASSL